MALDRLLADYLQREEGVRRLGAEIAAGGVDTVVGFVDLAGSTDLKQHADPADWLGYVQRFFQSIQAALGDGRIVKRIGDELMVTFASVESCERCLGELLSSSFFDSFPSRVAVDYGRCYHLQFSEGAQDDPYGITVDRCARIAARAQPGAIICSNDFMRESNTPGAYHSLGTHKLKGIAEPQELYLYQPQDTELSASYLAPLLQALAEPDLRFEGYRYASRNITVQSFQAADAPRSLARPFLLRELVRVPQLPFDAETLLQRVRDSHLPSPEHEYIGYLADWTGTVSSFSKYGDGSYTLYVELPSSRAMGTLAALMLTPEMYEAARWLSPGQAVRVRGLITAILVNIVSLNFAEFSVP
jgi:class 3 adenylate cyclase